ncbi:MAG: hypothetical protein PWQ35_539 [Patescibacteria group bacterium]|nr:hypothetical protein [Patescibacteria group bacterium]
MPRTITKKYYKKSPRLVSSSRQINNNTMKKEFVFPLIIGILFGAMLMMFWQFSARLTNQNSRLAQLEQYATQNSQTINEVVSFINQNIAPQEGAPTPAPAATE